jgi:hypothetical protein
MNALTSWLTWLGSTGELFNEFVAMTPASDTTMRIARRKTGECLHAEHDAISDKGNCEKCCVHMVAVTIKVASDHRSAYRRWLVPDDHDRTERYPTLSVACRTSLHLPAPQNGNFLGKRERLSREMGTLRSNPGNSETEERAKAPAFAGLLALSTTTAPET